MEWRQRVTNQSRGWSLMVAIGCMLVVAFSVFMVLKQGRIQNFNLHQSSSCQFPAIYNFGDSNSDTGAVSAVFHPVTPPYGMTYFQKPSGRYSDGRLMIDFIAERLGLPYLDAYVDSIGTNFRHGANFAASGATIQPADALMLNISFNPLTLDVQLSQFVQFKERSADMYSGGRLKIFKQLFQSTFDPYCSLTCIFIPASYVGPFFGLPKSSELKDRLPRSEEYMQALYTFDIGQNDLHAGITAMEEEQVTRYIPAIINEFASAVEKLYKGGARTFWIHNTGPIGCLPFFVKNFPPAPENADQIGCVKSYNEIAQEFNKQLKDKVSQLGTQLQEASLVYVDVYSVKYSLISEANKHGFIDPLGRCTRKDGVVSKACANPLQYINWDGIHYTEAANKWVANRLQDGSACSPKTPLTEACWAISGFPR